MIIPFKNFQEQMLKDIAQGLELDLCELTADPDLDCVMEPLTTDTPSKDIDPERFAQGGIIRTPTIAFIGEYN